MNGLTTRLVIGGCTVVLSLNSSTLRYVIKDQIPRKCKGVPIGTNEIDLNLFYTLGREELDAKLILTMGGDNFVKTKRIELGEDFVSEKINQVDLFSGRSLKFFDICNVNVNRL